LINSSASTLALASHSLLASARRSSTWVCAYFKVFEVLLERLLGRSLGCRRGSSQVVEYAIALVNCGLLLWCESWAGRLGLLRCSGCFQLFLEGCCCPGEHIVLSLEVIELTIERVVGKLKLSTILARLAQVLRHRHCVECTLDSWENGCALVKLYGDELGKCVARDFWCRSQRWWMCC
jgi:hypothetical protein